MKVFVTVGTTKFDHLIYQVFSEDVQKALADRGYTQMKVQFGKSKIEWEGKSPLLSFKIASSQRNVVFSY